MSSFLNKLDSNKCIFLLSIHFSVCARARVCMCTSYMCVCHGIGVEVGDNFMELVLPFHLYVNLGLSTRCQDYVASKCLYLVSHLPNQRKFILHYF